jgi:ABC-type branched-subunit amino acid transport system ATPase component
VIVFGMMMIIVLQRARDGLWPLLARLVPVRAEPKPSPRPSRCRGASHAPRRARSSKPKVTRKFGGLVANNNMSLSVKAGEILALIGPNGAGKSTMFNCISGVDTPTSGEVLFLGKPVGQLLRARSPAGHEPHLPARAPAADHERAGERRHRRPSARRKGVLSAAWRLDRAEEARLLAEAAPDRARRPGRAFMFDEAGSLAAGPAAHPVEIARALCADPCLLLLDEPAAGLRYLEKQALAELLRKLRGEGMGILLVEHDMDFVMGLADRVVVMEFGEKIAEGLPRKSRRIRWCSKPIWEGWR